MKWQKSPPELVERFERAVPGPPVETRAMFGYPAAFVNGHLFMGLFQSDMMLRLPEDARGELLAMPGARAFAPMPGRPMREYVVLPAALVGSPARLEPWVARALAYARSLPPKAGRGGTKKAAAAKPKVAAAKKPAVKSKAAASAKRARAARPARRRS